MQLNFMKSIRAIIIISLIQLWIFNVNAQERFSGKVVDSKTREPLELAVISSAHNKNIMSDRNGNFILNGTNKGDSIVISYIGYRSKKIVVLQLNKPVTILLDKGQVDLKEIVITTHSNNLTTSRTLSTLDLNMQPVKSAQDLLRLVPGLFIAQHQGGGKAEQIFLRGFDADHGTDVNVSVDGIPVNLVSQAHGQGYADLHFLIPETVEGYDFGKGPYYTNKGDFCTAGYVEYNTKNALDNDLVKVEAGQFNTIRGVALINLLNENAKLKGQNAYLAGEAFYTNGGPFDVPEHFNRFNLFGKFNTKIGASNKLMLSLSSLTSRWRAAGEIPNRAQAEGYIKDPFGSIDSSQGGYTSRANANVKLTSDLGNNFIWDNQAYYSHCYFDLISNFTFFYVNPITGDEFDQHEVRDLYGYNSKLSRRNIFGNTSLVSTAGIGLRYDLTHPSSLSHTEHGDFLGYLQRGNIKELNTNVYIDETIETGKWLLNAGARIDYFNFYYLNSAPSSDTIASIYHGLNTTKNKTIFSPKINVQYTVNSTIQLYIKTGKGFHSNDARVVIANKGNGILPAAYGSDVGINWKPVPRLFINTAIWYLFLEQEFVYGADYGDESVQPGGRTVRKGIDFSGRYQINNWLFGYLNIDLAKPRSTDDGKGKNYIPLAPGFTSTAGLLVNFKKGFNGGISYRYMHNRPANSNYSLIAKGYFIADLNANYTTKKYEIGLGIENLFNQSWNEAQFEYVTRLKYETAAVDEISNTPGIPFFAKLKLSVFF
jgi:TonB dependent receptor/TonB-dependent Receptor Plug Domain/CarboxypepD_reg-like domain